MPGTEGAILLVYVIEVVWLVVPFVAGFAVAMGPSLRPLAAVNNWIEPTTPLSLLGPATISAWSGDGPIQLLVPRPMTG